MRYATILLAFAGALAACSDEPDAESAGVEESPQRDVGSYEVDAETGEINARIHQDDGTVATMRSGEEVPVDLPSGFTLYPDAEVLANTRVDHGGGRGVLLTMRSGDEPGELAAFYRRQADAAGVAIEVEMAAGGTAMFAGKSPDDLTVSFNVSKESGATMAQLMVGTGME
ncbi:hypothetical protein [Qipengyuania sp. MTN3-11]|uniref:hypothetical protein n=1 Tax=Qipengyuania sp. MTN3-11 TaxID=3056557 RepID=UPI0036F41F41